MKNLFAVLVHFGNPIRTEQAVRALQSCSAIKRTVVILHSPYSLLRDFESVDWIESDNLGYAAGLNQAARFLSKEYGDESVILALNPDVRIDATWVEAIFADHIASDADCTFPVLREKEGLIHGYTFSRFGTLKSVDDPEWHSGACFLFSLEVWKAVGGLDETYFHYFEDRDFCLRLKQAGFRCRLASSVIVPHEAKSGADYPASELPRFAVRNHLMALDRSQLLGPLSFVNVAVRHFLYLFRWEKGWRGIRKWRQGISEFLSTRTL